MKMVRQDFEIQAVYLDGELYQDMEDEMYVKKINETPRCLWRGII